MTNKKPQNQSTTTTTTVKKSSGGYMYFMNILSYVAVCVGGLALFIAMILSKCGISIKFTSTMTTIANAIGWAVLCLLSFNYISRRKKLWMWIVWAVAIVMIITSIIL